MLTLIEILVLRFNRKEFSNNMKKSFHLQFYSYIIKNSPETLEFLRKLSHSVQELGRERSKASKRSLFSFMQLNMLMPKK